MGVQYSIKENVTKYLFIFMIRLYQYTIGSLIGSCCRFHPSCSEYSIAVFKKYGVIKGIFLTIKRILKCNPWHPGGPDLP